MRPLAALSLLFVSLPAYPWGPEGHSLIARIAETQLTPAAQTRVAAILGPGRTLSSVASWADEIRPNRRDTANWHFVDIPIEKAHFDPERDCAKGDCVVSAIARFRGVLHDPAATADQQREALQFLIHFVGDMHQPLHSSDHEDRGGNTVQLQFHDRRTNLHSLWDSGMLGRLGTEDQLFPALSQESARNRKKFAKGNPTQWAEQTHKIGRKFVYGKLPKAVNGGPVTIDGAYEAAAAPIIRGQLERAGARLAAVLNAEFK